MEHRSMPSSRQNVLWFLCSCVLTVVSLVAGPARAELTIEITEGVSDPIPIAIVPFGAGGGAPTFDVAQVVANDLKRSGLFEPMARKDMVDKPTRGEEVKLDDWRLLRND